MSAKIRPARPEERFAVLGLARDFHAASGLPFAFDPAHASRAAQDHIEDPRKLCLILEVRGAVRGVLAASWAVSPLAPVRVAQELVFWIDPAHRGRAALGMIGAYEDWARAEGCAAAGLSSLDDPRVARLFSFAGFNPAENKFLKMMG